MKKSISRRQFPGCCGRCRRCGRTDRLRFFVQLHRHGRFHRRIGRSFRAPPPLSGDTIKVGLLAPLTGDVSVYGIAVANGANLYIKQINEAGGINGKQVEVIEMDEQGDATQAVTCFTQMVDQGITALIGDVTTTPTLAVVAETQDYNMPMVTRLRYRRGRHLRRRDRHRLHQRVPHHLHRPVPGREDGRLCHRQAGLHQGRCDLPDRRRLQRGPGHQL